MEEDNEVLDWGNEEDEHHQEPHRTPSFTGDADDVVSLGDEDEDHTYYAHQVPENGSGNSIHSAKAGIDTELDPASKPGSTLQDAGAPVGRSSESPKLPRQGENQTTSSLAQSSVPGQHGSPKRSQHLLQPRLTHALPPKPIAATLPYIPPSHPSIVEATAMAVRTREFKRSATSADKPSNTKDSLPPNWEVRHPRSGGRTVYYYNVLTHQSTWHHPGYPPLSNRTKSGGNSSKAPEMDSYVPQPLSYEDRHYRPGESPDTRHEGRANEGPELRPVTPPPGSPRSQDHPCSASPPPAPQEQPAEIRDKSRSVDSNCDADLKEARQAGNHDLAVSDTSASRRSTSKTRSDSNGLTNLETHHQGAVPTSSHESAPPTKEDRPLSRSQSARGHNHEREPSRDTVEGRQGLNHSLSLSSSRPRSPSRDREWISAHREPRETESVQKASVIPTKDELTPRPIDIPSGTRRERPSRFDQPSTTPLQSSPPATVPQVAVEQASRPRERDVYIPDDMNAPHRPLPDLNAGRDNIARFSQKNPIEGSKFTYTGDNRLNPAHGGPDRRIHERVLPDSDEPGSSPRRKRAPLPPQAASFREETSRRRDHDTSKTWPMRPTGLAFPTGQEHWTPSSTSLDSPFYGPSVSVSGSRIEQNSEHHRRFSSSIGESGGSQKILVTEDEQSKGYPHRRPPQAIDVAMNIDRDHPPSSSSKFPSRPPPQARDDDMSSRWSLKAVTSNSMGAATPSTETSMSFPPEELRREDFMELQTRPDYSPTNQRAAHERPDRNGPRESGGRSREPRPGLASSAPKLTGPNSVPIMLPRYKPEPPLMTLKSVPPPVKESYATPSYNVRAAVDSYKPSYQDFSPDQHHRKVSPPHYKREHRHEPVNIAVMEGHRDLFPPEQSRFDQPGRENRPPQPYNKLYNEPRTHSSISERTSIRDRVPTQRSPSEPSVSVLLSDRESMPAKAMLDRTSEDGRQFRRGKQEQQKQQAEGLLPPRPPSPLVRSVEETSRRHQGFQKFQQEIHRPPRPSLPQLPPPPPKTTFGEEPQYNARGQGQGLMQHSAPRPLSPNIRHPKEASDRANSNWLPRRSESFNAQGTSTIDQHTDHSRRSDLHPVHDDRPYGARSIEQPQYISPIHEVSNDPNPYSQSLRQRQSERSRPVEIPPMIAPAQNERRTRWRDSGSSLADNGGPESSDSRLVRRPSLIDRYEPDYGDGTSMPQRRRPPPRLAREDSQHGDIIEKRDDNPPHRNRHEFRRTSTRPLIDRLSESTHPISEHQIVRDMVTVPEKRDRNAVDHDFLVDIPHESSIGTGEPVNKRARRRANKPRRGRRGSGAA